MALRVVLTSEDEMLHKKCREITDFGRRTQRLIDDMLDTVVKENGVGLAAPQVGVLRRVVVLHNGERFVELVNPTILKSEGEQIGTEACLSCPGEVGIVKRPQQVTFRAQNRDGEWYEMTCTNLSARAVFHELDHLDGILYTERAIKMLTEEEFEELQKESEEE